MIRPLTAQEAPPAPQAPVEAALSDQDYLVRLGLMRGHLLVGHELYGLNALDAARSHSKHPTDELYAGMEREFAARRTTGFADELQPMPRPPSERTAALLRQHMKHSPQRSRGQKRSLTYRPQ